jgi:COP9 signalosome complex subunit 4
LLKPAEKIPLGFVIIMSASGDVVSKLQQLENSPPTTQRAEAYNSTLSEIINTFTGSDLAANLIAYVQSILSDNIGVIASRPLLSAFVEQYRGLKDNDVKVEAGNEIIQLLAPKTVSFEQQDTDLKFALADAYEAEDYTNSAKTLQVITLDSSQRSVSDNEKAQVWIRICRCYLEEENPTNAVTYLNRLKQIIYNVTDQSIKLHFQLSQARISDSMNQFLDASTAYYALSTDRLIDEEERLHTLSASITCAVLAPAGPARARQLGRLYKDDRAADTPEFSILEKIFLDRLLAPAEVAAFAAGLKDHQLAKTSDGSTVLDKAVLEHNLLAVSRLYQNISIDALGTLLGTDADRAEAYAAGMIESSRLSGSIDQIEGVIHFNTKEGGKDSGAMDLRAWDANIQGLAEEVEKVTTMLQREEATWYEAQVAA